MSGQNLVASDPSLKDLLDLFRKDLLLGLSCHHIGTVQTFNPLLQTATVTINYKKTFYEPNPVTGVYGPVLYDYPPLIDCPVICLGGGSAALTFPIKSGDECLVLFNDRDLDTWFAASSSAEPATARLHSFADAVILVGVRSLKNVLLNYDSSRTALANGLLSRVAVSISDAALEYGPSQQPTSRIWTDASSASMSYGTVSLKLTATGLSLTGGAGVPVTVSAGAGAPLSLMAGAGAQVAIGAGGQTLGQTLQQLISQLNQLTTNLALLTVTCTAPGNPSSPPLNAAAFTAIGVNLTTISTTLSGFLS